MGWLISRFRYAGRGFRNGAFTDRSIRLQLLLGLAACAAAWWLGCSWQEWLWILLSIALVVSGEIFNSCIEKTLDYISLKRDPRAALIKDLAAAGVSVLCLFAALTGCFIFVPKILEVFAS